MQFLITEKLNFWNENALNLKQKYKTFEMKMQLAYDRNWAEAGLPA